MTRCARCSFSADDLTDHAREAGHLLCIVCQRRSLKPTEAQTCATCVARVRADLADIVTENALIEPTGITALTLLADGTMQRHMHGYELDTGARDEWPSDPLPVLAALASWEDYLRQDYRDPKGAVPATLTETIDYLTTNLDTRHNFAQTFPGFDDLAAEIRRHHTTVRHAAGLADDPLEAEAECRDCGGSLVRDYAPPTDDDAERRARAREAVRELIEPVRRQREAERSYGPGISLTPWPSMEARRGAATALSGRSGEGLTDKWRCADCRRVYDQQEYFIGLRIDTEMWVPVPLAAKTAQRSPWTLRSWMRRLMVGSVCRVDDRSVLVWWPDVSDRAFRHVEAEAS